MGDTGAQEAGVESLTCTSGRIVAGVLRLRCLAIVDMPPSLKATAGAIMASNSGAEAVKVRAPTPRRQRPPIMRHHDAPSRSAPGYGPDTPPARRWSCAAAR